MVSGKERNIEQSLGRGDNRQVPGKKSQAEAMACAKALGQDGCWHIGGVVKRSIWMSGAEGQGEGTGGSCRAIEPCGVQEGLHLWSQER